MVRQPDVEYVRFYTDGSAARKVATVTPLKTMRLPKARKHKKILLMIDPVAIVGIGMAVVMFVMMAVGVAQLLESRQQLESMDVYVQQLEQEKMHLEQTFQDGYDIQAVEKTALALGLVPKEQVRHVYIDIPQSQAPREANAWEQIYIFLTGLFA